MEFFGKSGIIVKFKNLPIVQRLSKTPLGEMLISLKNKGVNAYNKFMEATGLYNLLQRDTWQKAGSNVNNFVNIVANEFNKFKKDPGAYLKGCANNTINWFKKLF